MRSAQTPKAALSKFLLFEDIKLCAKWARSEAHSCPFGPSKLNTKKDVVDTVFQIEDFDPTLFENRRVEKGGRPTFVITPGVGHGSYDFRSNTIVLPLVSPRDRLESVVYAIALATCAVRPADRIAMAQDLRKDTNAASAYRIGVLAGQSGRLGDAHGWFTKAAAMDSESLEILWALGVMHILPDSDLKTGEAGSLKTMSLRDRLTKTKESMDKFVKLSRPSWWLLEAQDHLRKINELRGQMARWRVRVEIQLTRPGPLPACRRR